MRVPNFIQLPRGNYSAGLRATALAHKDTRTSETSEVSWCTSVMTLLDPYSTNARFLNANSNDLVEIENPKGLV